MITFGPKLVTTGLVMAVDANDVISYTSGSTYWRDITGNGHHLTMSIVPSMSTSWPGSAEFTGSNYWGTTTTRPLSYLEYTKCIWVKMASLTGASSHLIGASPAETHNFYTANGGVAGGHGSFSTINSSQAIVTGSWYFISVTYSTSSGWRIYINNTLTGTATDTRSFSGNLNGNLGVGGYQNKSFSSGSISAVYIYNRALTTEEISSNYTFTKKRYGH